MKECVDELCEREWNIFFFIAYSRSLPIKNKNVVNFFRWGIEF